MTIDQKTTISVEDIRNAMPHALEIVDLQWLNKQRKHRSNSKSLVQPNASLRTRSQNLHAVAMGPRNDAMHPVAECIVAAERALHECDNGIPTVPSAILFTRLLSLRDIALARKRVSGTEERLARLKGDEWKPALYELLTAISYSDDLEPTLIPEKYGQATPDLQVNTDPVTLVECKARLKYEVNVIEFTRNWRRKQLSQIHKAIVPGPNSYIVRVEIESLENYEKEPDGSFSSKIKEMIANKISHFADPSGQINIDYYSAERTVLENPMPAMTQEFWNHGWGFNEWEDWHYILPTGEVALLDSDPRLANQYGQRIIICVRARELTNNVPSLTSTLKDACRRQLQRANSGIIHVLIDSHLFGLGKDRSIKEIQSRLEPEIHTVFRNYSRLWRLYIDVVDRGDYFETNTPSARRLEATNPSVAAPDRFQAPSPIILV